jgi:hypothetical protein
MSENVYARAVCSSKLFLDNLQSFKMARCSLSSKKYPTFLAVTELLQFTCNVHIYVITTNTDHVSRHKWMSAACDKWLSQVEREKHTVKNNPSYTVGATIRPQNWNIPTTSGAVVYGTNDLENSD